MEVPKFRKCLQSSVSANTARSLCSFLFVGNYLEIVILLEDDSNNLDNDDEEVSVDDHVPERIRVLRVIAEHKIFAIWTSEPRNHSQDGDYCLN